MMQYLVTNGLSKTNERDNDGYSPLLMAANNGHIEVVKYLLKNTLSSCSERTDLRDTPLLLAASNGQIEMVKYLLNNELSKIYERNNDGSSALLLAACHGHLPTVQFLLKKGAGVDALMNSRLTTCQFIQRHPRSKKETLPLIAAAETLLRIAPYADENPEKLSNALNILDGALNGTRVYDGNSALHLAILHKNKALVRILLERGADTELPNNDNRTPQQLALYSGVPYIKHCFNLRKIDELPRAPVAMELDSDEEAAKDSKEAKESKETKEAKESLEHNRIQTKSLDKLIEETFKGIQELSDQEERNELFYYLGTILCKADSPSSRPLLVELIKEKQKTDSENERLSAEIESIKSRMMDIDSVSQSAKKRKDSPSMQDNLEPSSKRIRLENSIDVSKGSSPVIHHYESSKTEEAIFPQRSYSAQLAPVAKLNIV